MSKRSIGIGIAFVVMGFTVVALVGATHAPVTANATVTADTAPACDDVATACDGVTEAPLSCEGHRARSCHGETECRGPESGGCRGHDGNCEEDCHTQRRCPCRGH